MGGFKPQNVILRQAQDDISQSLKVCAQNLESCSTLARRGEDGKVIDNVGIEDITHTIST